MTSNQSTIIFGTWQAGKKHWVGINDAHIRDSIAASLDYGITSFDTAPVYGDGLAETILGDMLHHKRDQIELISKVSPHRLEFQEVIQSCEESLVRLKTQTLDMLCVHWPAGSYGSEHVPWEDTMRAFLSLKESGKIKRIGLSNVSHEQLNQAMRWGTVDAIQNPFSLFWNHFEHHIRPIRLEHSMELLAYSPLGQGILTGRFKPGHAFQSGDHRKRNILFKPHLSKAIHSSLEKMNELANQKECSMAQIALAWVMNQPNTRPIVGMRSIDQLIDNAAALHIKLSKEEQIQLDKIGQHVVQFLDQKPVMWR